MFNVGMLVCLLPFLTSLLSPFLIGISDLKRALNSKTLDTQVTSVFHSGRPESLLILHGVVTTMTLWRPGGSEECLGHYRSGHAGESML